MTTDLERLERIEQLVGELKVSLGSSRVTNGAELADALIKGGQIRLPPGDYVGNFVVTAPTVLTEDQPGGAHLRPLDQLFETLEVRASHVGVQGLTIHNGAPDRECVVVGQHYAHDPATQPDDVTFDATTVLAGDQGGHRGFSLHGRTVTLRRCSVRNFFERGRESQAVWINNGPGPYLIEDCYLEASGENILVGGDTLSIPVNPSDITIRRNTLRKRATWKGTDIVIKNIFELKAGVNVLFEDNTLDGCWAQGQSGTPIVLTPRNQTGDSPHVQVDQVIIQRNVVLNCPDGYALNILGADNIHASQPMVSLDLVDNLFVDTPGGLLIGNAAALELGVKRNTFVGIKNTFLTFYGPKLKALVYEANVVRSGAYGIHGDDNVSVGRPSLEASVAELLFERNVIEQSAERTLKYPANNRLIAPGGLAALLDAQHRMLDKSAGYGL